MLDYFFRSPTRLRQLRRGPLGEHLDGLAAELRRHGYTMSTARRILPIAGRFSRFLEAVGVANVAAIDEALTARFVAEELGSEGLYHGAGRVMACLLAYLHGQGIAARTPVPKQEGPHDALLEEYDEHLRTVRGLAASTRYNYRKGALRFLAWLDGHRVGTPLAELVGSDVLAFVLDCVETPNGRSRDLLANQLRSFLRYLRWNGTVQEHLDRVVPSVRRYRLATLPRHLPWTQVRAVIDSVDTTQSEGMRDKAILLMLAGLGLRNHEVRHLECGDIVWRKAQVRVRRSKGSKERILPLPEEVGVAVADYLLHGRPLLEIPQVFVRHRAPQGPFSTTTAVAAVVASHLKRARIPVTTAGRGAHLLRHSLATRMVNEGVRIKDIADILGHSSIDTTAVYAKVDIAGLAEVALPFIGGAE